MSGTHESQIGKKTRRLYVLWNDEPIYASEPQVVVKCGARIPFL